MWVTEWLHGTESYCLLLHSYASAHIHTNVFPLKHVPMCMSPPPHTHTHKIFPSLHIIFHSLDFSVHSVYGWYVVCVCLSWPQKKGLGSTQTERWVSLDNWFWWIHHLADLCWSWMSEELGNQVSVTQHDIIVLVGTWTADPHKEGTGCPLIYSSSHWCQQKWGPNLWNDSSSIFVLVCFTEDLSDLTVYNACLFLDVTVNNGHDGRDSL